MLPELLQKANLFSLLYRIDQDLAESVKANKCRFCQSRLDSANYLRKPRGGPADIDEAHLVRFSLCCSREGCRRRTLPPSARFDGRRVYWGCVILVVMALRQNAYNSCGNRHCPKCRAMAREQWLAARKAELLPVGYFHNVFTLPHDLNPVLLCNMKPMLEMLFTAVNETLQAFAADPRWRLEGRLGFIAVLHTWSRTLMDHFHLHCLIPGGVLTFDRTAWRPARKKFLFRKDSLAKEFKKRYLRKLEDAYRNNELIFPGNTAETGTSEGFNRLVRKLRSSKWVAYAKRPFAGPAQVLEYLGRYTHRVAISNNRIRSIDDGKVTFTYRDRKERDAIKEMTLDADEFIRRFLLHVLPKGFMKIRYFGYLFHRDKKASIALIRNLIDPDGNYGFTEKESVQEIMLRLIGLDITRCPSCGKGQMVHVVEIPKGSSPVNETRGRYCRSP